MRRAASPDRRRPAPPPLGSPPGLTRQPVGSGSRGRPRRRSAITLRWISLVPPAIVRQRLARKPNVHWAAAPTVVAPSGPSSAEPELLGALVVLHAEQLADARLGPGLGAGDRALRRCAARARPRCGPRPPARRAGRAGAGRLRAAPSPMRSADQAEQRLDAATERRAAAHRHPLVGQRGAGQRPAAVDLADHAVVGHEHVVEEHLVEHLQPGHLPQRPDVDARACACRR